VTVALALAPVPRIEADAEGLEKLCLNLLDNAVKYNRPGGRVEVRLARRGDELVVEVEDTGRGIPEASLPRLFERFYRVDRGRSRDEGGTGLGLAIVKHAAQRHGGSVEVESRLGEGSTFRVRLPLAGGSGEST
jgi:two-component system phosphate regulon sensor histidine kinase PhoR